MILGQMGCDPPSASIENYTGGRMGISAVPGSGKTHTLSYLAADLILSGDLDLNQEVLDRYPVELGGG